MTNIREYYDIENRKSMSFDQPFDFIINNEKIRFNLRFIFDADSGSKFLSCLLDGNVDVIQFSRAFVGFVLTPRVQNLINFNLQFHINDSEGRVIHDINSAQSTFTKKIWLYWDSLLTPEIKDEINEINMTSGLFFEVRDQKYAEIKSNPARPDVFISHDSRDKDDFVRPLVEEMTKLGCTVWYDEYSLKIGDNLRSSIDKGLKESKKCVIVLSESFINNNGWTQTEFDSIFSREMHKKENVILPIWHNVDKNDVYDYAAILMDRIALNSSKEDISTIAKKLVKVIKG